MDLYIPYESERFAFGTHWCGPEKYRHGKDALVARYPRHPDGYPVKVFCAALPARFYTLHVLPAKDSLGRSRPGFRVSFGSGDPGFVARVAEKIARGGLTREEAEAYDL